MKLIEWLEEPVADDRTYADDLDALRREWNQLKARYDHLPEFLGVTGPPTAAAASGGLGRTTPADG